VQLKDLFIGSTVSVYSRQLKIVDYADDFTARAFGPKRSRCLAIILPDGYEQIGKFLSHMTSEAKGGCGATLARVKMLRFNRSQAESFFAREQGSASFAYDYQHIVFFIFCNPHFLMRIFELEFSQ
jgi:nucleoside-diphosphate kinase